MSNVTSWSAISDAQAESLTIPTALPVEDNSSRVISGPLRMMGTQEVTSMGTHRITSSDLAPTSGGIMATAQNNAGFPTTRITSDTTVELPGGLRTSLKVAESMGYITRTFDGRYVDAQQQPAQAHAEADKGQQAADGVELFSQRAEAEYSALIADVPQPVYDSILGSAAAILGEGSDMEALTAKLTPRLASAMGMDPAEAAKAVQAGAGMWQEQADSKLKTLGVEPSEFYEWAAANRKGEFQQAIIQHLMGRSTKGYEGLVEAYLTSVLPSLEALKARGIPTKTQNGTTLVQLKGSWVSLQSAVKARLL